MAIDVGILQKLASVIHQVMVENRDYLCEIDSHLGDGDHGISMEIGWRAVRNVEAPSSRDCGEYLRSCAQVFIKSVGASIGPLYGTAFLRAARVTNGKLELSVDECIQMCEEAIQGIAQRGDAKVGDKTLVDTLLPSIAAMRHTWDETRDVILTAIETRKAAESGMNSTRMLVSKIGRASRLGERSKGELDPGAVSAFLIIKTVTGFVEKVSLNGESHIDFNGVK